MGYANCVSWIPGTIVEYHGYQAQLLSIMDTVQKYCVSRIPDKVIVYPGYQI